MYTLYVVMSPVFIDVALLCPEIRISDSGREIAVGKNNLLLRGCVIRNTDWVEGMVVYAGLLPTVTLHTL